MDYLPNIDAVTYFYREILPAIKAEIPNIVFEIVGRNPTEELFDICTDAVITGEVNDVRDYLATAAVFVAPMRLAFGVQNKILEAMAACVPVVSTDRALSGLHVREGEEILIADSPADFAQCCIALIQNQQLAESICSNAKQHVQQEHDWDLILAGFEASLETKANGNRSPHRVHTRR